MVYKLVPNTDPILLKPTINFDFHKDNGISSQELFENMKATLIEIGGLGLSCNQVGLPYNMFIVGNSNDPDNIFPVFNGKIVDYSEDTTLLEEGCLSYPGLVIKIKRSNDIRLRFDNLAGERGTFPFSGMTARIIQHEMHHMNGEKFYINASRYHIDLGFNKYMKSKKRVNKLWNKNYQV